MKAAMTKNYETDENGKPVLDKNGNKVEQPIGSIYISQDKSVNYYALTQADSDELMTVINAATKVLRNDQSIVDIITDESKAYFNGENLRRRRQNWCRVASVSTSTSSPDEILYRWGRGYPAPTGMEHVNE